MRVLDVGCGYGELSQIVAELVGKTGEVVGFDISKDAVTVANKSIFSDTLAKVTFLEADIAKLPSYIGQFDIIFGRRVLMYQNNLSQSIGNLLPFLSENGEMVFEESDSTAISLNSPKLTLHIKVLNWIWDTVVKEGGNTNIGMQLYTEMKNAGLGISLFRAETILHTCETGSDLWWVAHKMAPRMLKHNVVTEEELDIKTLSARLLDELKNNDITFIRDMTFGICAKKLQQYTLNE
jgi:SAM-dependent methyltransferase